MYGGMDCGMDGVVANLVSRFLGERKEEIL